MSTDSAPSEEAHDPDADDEEPDGILVVCHRLDCGNEWHYTGRKEHYATCTNCYSKTKIHKSDAEIERLRAGVHPWKDEAYEEDDEADD